MSEEMKLTGVLDSVDGENQDSELTFGEVVDGLGDRGYGPLLIIVCLIEILPTGAIPGVPTLVALAVILIAGQLLLGRETPWLPQLLRKRKMEREKFEKGREKIKPFTKKVDKVIRPRLKFMTTAVGEKIAAFICMLLALTFPPLEVIPFASSGPSLAIVVIALGLSSRDGLLLLLGLIGASAAMVLATSLMLF